MLAVVLVLIVLVVILILAVVLVAALIVVLVLILILVIHVRSSENLYLRHCRSHSVTKISAFILWLEN